MGVAGVNDANRLDEVMRTKIKENKWDEQQKEPFMERSWPPGVASCDVRRADMELGAVMVNAFA